MAQIRVGGGGSCKVELDGFTGNEHKDAKTATVEIRTAPGKPTLTVEVDNIDIDTKSPPHKWNFVVITTK